MTRPMLATIRCEARDPHTYESLRDRYNGQPINPQTVWHIKTDIATIAARTLAEGATGDLMRSMSYLYAVLGECIDHNPSLGGMV